jgi:hypothetical protein
MEPVETRVAKGITQCGHTWRKKATNNRRLSTA